MKLRDKLGWPVMTFKNKPVLNFFRYIIHFSIWQTFRLRNTGNKEK